jgi:hypothetical protein
LLEPQPSARELDRRKITASLTVCATVEKPTDIFIHSARFRLDSSHDRPSLRAFVPSKLDLPKSF